MVSRLQVLLGASSASEGLTPGEPSPDDNEEFVVRTFALADAWAMVERDELRDAKSQIALAWAMRNGAAG